MVAESTVGVDTAKLTYIQPHMHLRAKDYELRLIYPTGESQVVFKGKWDFDWQLGYDLKEPIVLPKGTRIAHHRALRQLAQQQVQSGPAEDRVLGSAELG